ncbi:MAG: caspase family protein [Elusimicrobia bacterium]|nr:caspase family protein [Elusimicrobiota bacterium]
MPRIHSLFLLTSLLPFLAGCATVVARHQVTEEVPRVSFKTAKKDLLAAFKTGLLEKRGFVAATMRGWSVSEVREDAVDLVIEKYLGLLSDQVVATKVTCAYDDMDGAAINQYKTGGAGRAANLTYEVPLGHRCADLAMFWQDKGPAETFAKALLAMKLRAAQGPTPEEEAASRPQQGISKEDLASIVQAAVAGATGASKPEARTAPAPSSDIDTPSHKLPERPDDFAVVVGVSRYSDIPEAQYADRDAEAVKKHLLSLGLPSRNVVHLTGEKAGYKAIEKFVETWLPRNADERSRVFFYFSGHGAPDPQTGQAYLLPFDGDPSFLENTGYPLKRLYEKLSSLKATEVVVVLDACFSGAGGRSVLAKGARPLVMTTENTAVPGNLTVFAAASADQVTSTLDDQGHGAFTYYFLKGLSGAAKDASGRVTAQGLLDYLKPKVADAARVQNREQAPVLQGRADRELVRY